MHTDEYEISLGREIALCRAVIKRLTNALQAREKRYGMSTEAFLQVFDQGQLTGPKRDLRKWREDHQELPKWQQKLKEYQQALSMVKQT